MREYDFYNINEFFEELDNKPNPNIYKMMIWESYKRNCEIQKELKAIEDLYRSPSNPRNTCIAWKINQDMYVVQFRNDLVSGYYAHVNNTRSHELFDTFDKAVLGCLAIKYTGGYDAAVWAAKMLGM